MRSVPIRTALAGFVGIGVAVAGGNDNVIARNRIVRSERYGIAVFPTALYVSFDPAVPMPGPPWRPRGNRVFGNTVTGSGTGRPRARERLGPGQLLSREPRWAEAAAQSADARLPRYPCR